MSSSFSRYGLHHLNVDAHTTGEHFSTLLEHAKSRNVVSVASLPLMKYASLLRIPAPKPEDVNAECIAAAHEEIARLPDKHAARTDPDLIVSRTDVTRLTMPPLATVTNRLEMIFEAAPPVTSEAEAARDPAPAPRTEELTT